MPGGLIALHGLILIAVVEDGSVIGSINHEGVLGEALLLELGQDTPHLIIERHDGVTTRAQGRAACVTRIMHARHMVLMRSVVEEEWLGLVGRDERAGLVGEHIAHGLVIPKGRLTALHPTDAPDAVHQGHIMTVRPIHLQLGPLGRRREVGVAWKRILVADFNRILGVEPDHSTILDEDGRDAVTRGGHDVRIRKADLVRTRADWLIPIDGLTAQTEVPLADDAGGVAQFGEARW